MNTTATSTEQHPPDPREGSGRERRQPAEVAILAHPLIDPRPAPEVELILDLEPDQLVAMTSLPVEQAVLASRTIALLWALRLFVLVMSAMVLYAFVDRLS